MPAMYVSNPRDSKGRFKRARRATVTAKGPTRSSRRRRRSNPAHQQVMFQPPAPRPNRRRKPGRRSTSASPRRRAAGGRRRRPASHRPRLSRGWTYRRRANPRGKGGRFVARRGRGRPRRRGNALTLSNPLGGIPVLGTAVGLIGPAFFGALGVELIGQVLKFVTKSWAVPEMVQPYVYTIGGLILAGIVQLFVFIPAPIRHSIGVGLASAGGAVDWYRYRSASGAYGSLDMGDGGEWVVETLSDTEAFGALEMAGLDFSGDEDYAGLDFSMAEGTALDEGYGAYLKRFPLKKHPKALRMVDRPNANTPKDQIHDPRREGDRWHWLVAMVGPEDAKRVAGMPPEQRVKQIAACKQACKATLRHPQTFAPTPQKILTERMPAETPIDQGVRERARYDAFSTAF